MCREIKFRSFHRRREYSYVIGICSHSLKRRGASQSQTQTTAWPKYRRKDDANSSALYFPAIALALRDFRLGVMAPVRRSERTTSTSFLNSPALFLRTYWDY